MRFVVSAIVMMTALAFPAAAHSSLLFDEDFTGPNTDVPFRVGGSSVPCLTASQDTAQGPIPGCAPGGPSLPPTGDPAGSGALRLTDNETHRSSYAIYDAGLPFTAGLIFTFDAFAYNGTPFPGFPDHGADGISVFIKDAEVQDQSPGAFGGSLGYAQSNDDFNSPYTQPATIPGVPGGYFGVGIDEFGNFANDREARGFGCATRADMNLHQNTISLRGPGLPGTGWLEGYCLRESELAPASLDQVNALLRTDPGVARRYRIEVDPPSDPGARVRLLTDFDLDGDFTPLLDVSQPLDPPTTFEFGFGASTGDATNIHEVRAVRAETVDPLPTFDLTKSHQGTFVAGQDGSFVIQASVRPNTGSARAPVTVDDTLPVGVTVSALPHGTGWDCSNTIIGSREAQCVYDIDPDDPVPPGTQLPPITLPVRLDPNLTGQHINHAVLSGPEILDPLEADDPFVLERRADIVVTKVAEPGRVDIGETVGFTVSVANLGPSDAHQVQLVDQIPAGLALLDVDPGQDGTCSRTVEGFRCDLGTIPVGEAKSISLTARAEAPPGARVNTARADAAEDDPNPSNNEDEATVEIQGAPRLSITKRAGSRQVRVGQNVDYTIKVENTGNATASNVTVVDSNSAKVRVVRAKPERGNCRIQGRKVTCRLGNIGAGATRTIKMTVQMLAAGRSRNSAVAKADETQDVQDLATVRVVGRPALRISKRSSRTRVPLGGTVRYRIRVRSVGTGVARNVRVCDRLPRELRLASPARLQGRRKICWKVGDLRPGQVRSFRVLAYATRSGRGSNRAVATASNAAAAKDRRPVSVFDSCPPSGLWSLRC